MSKKYIEFKVVGQEEELKSFTTLLQLIQSFGRYGMSRKVKVDVDGDGSGRLGFSILKEDGKKEELPPFQLDELRQLEKTTEHKYTVYIGE
jgi:hypothetical protein